jgi:hypothetical protein
MKKMRLFKTATILLVAIAFCDPVFAHAATSVTSSGFQIFPAACNCTHLVNPAGGFYDSAPAWGCVLQAFQNILTFFVAFATLVITIFIAWAGFTYMTSGGAPEKRQLANQRILNAVIGLAIVLCAYLIVDSIMKVIYNPSNANFGPWNSILAEGSNVGTNCLALHNPPNALPSTSNPAVSTPTAPTTPTSAAGSGASGLNTSAAVAWLQANVTTTQSSGICLTDIQRALNAGGLSLQCGAPPGHSGYAGYCNSSLQALNFTALGGSDSNPQPGDILVIQHSTGTQIGHITMYTGSAWVSDFVQSNGESPPGNPYGSAGYSPQYWRP